jgi:pyruvate dehydrogenase E1 component alpha subunit
LVDYTQKIISFYKAKKIRAPIHLCDNNEKKLIKLFKKLKIKKSDWIFTTYRNSYVWLLSGRNENELTKQILAGNSMHVYGKNFFTSAIVAGHLPIAVGVAWALKLKKSKKRVFCFCGDMASTGGLFHESVKYAQGHDLPITFIIENNFRSVKTNTESVWSKKKKNKVIKYSYHPHLPHAGIGEFVLF